MNAHDRFESLAGAVALGEATPDERTQFATHAASCAACREDAEGGTEMVAAIAAARRTETWRPSQPIVDRIRARRNVRARFTVGALGWAVGLSLVLNVALAGGIGSRLIGAFQARTEVRSTVASSALSLDAPHVAVVAPHVWRRPVAVVARAVLKKRVRPAVDAAIPVAKLAAPSNEEKLPTLDDVPDVLAGIDMYGTDAHHRVAVQVLPRCAPAQSTADGDVADARPCRDANGRIER